VNAGALLLSLQLLQMGGGGEATVVDPRRVDIDWTQPSPSLSWAEPDYRLRWKPRVWALDWSN
jgi:hypothetical protein